MKQTLIAVAALLLGVGTLTAQCPQSSFPGTHIIQKGETLYSIAKMYGISVRDITVENNITTSTVLPACAGLRIPTVTTYERGAETARIETTAVPTTTPAPAGNTADISTYAMRLLNSRGTHIAAAGESLESIAAYYGYTPGRMREMNSVGATYQVTPGAVLVVSECYFQNGTTQPNAGGNVGFNAGNMGTTSVNFGNTTTAATKAKPTVPTATTNQPAVETPRGATGDFPPAAAAYMKSEELSMVDEINLVRSNPAGYIPYIEEYKAKIQRGEGFGSLAVADELIAELRNTPPRSVLQPLECLYRAARQHGEDQRPTGSVDHIGTDGSWPWDRVLRACPKLTDGNENLVGGPASVRDAVIILLIDDGIPGRGHRKTMLQPDWKYVATYKIGKVGIMPNSWVQKFAY